ncbi:hypothetical protein [Amycolatopsis sp. BJA-103]|uniref:hypothetical protein n=1 Tax=Amycolatopsis sp. BJA-103 TaxID=1911175 RepID=UPI000C78F816|nr:hypothetical protein [Amycolatopsis sp. BJA-103]AUI61351.1 hypothetical protein BKN51_26340 [Amycolatopsis sp. BJA-103]PNE21358.1 hypothetical protein B1H26_06120 [Amycolatopsis sp. BJA-103]
MMDLLLEFAGSGRIGPIHGGMTLNEASEILGPGHPHPAIRMLGERADGYPYNWESLSLDITRNQVSSITLKVWPGGTFTAPSPLDQRHEPQDSTVTKHEFLAALNKAQIGYKDVEIPATDQQSAIHFVNTGVSAIFGFFEESELITLAGNYLISVSKDCTRDIL